MATNYTGNATPTLNNAPANSWATDAEKRSHVGNTYLVTGSGGTAGNVYAFEEYPSAVVKEVPASGLPADIVTITDGGENLPMTSAEVSLSPIQSGSGDPSPTNIRPISGHTGAELKIGSTYPTADNTYSVTFTSQGTVYGGTYDFVSGKLRVEYGSYTFTGSESWTKGSYPWGYDTSITANGYSTTISGIKSSAKANIISDAFVLSSTTARNLRAAIEWSRVDCCINNVVGFDYIVIRYDSITDSATFAQYMAGKTIVYELETPLEYDLTPQQIETLQGENNVWSDAGPISKLVYRSNQYVMAYDWFETWTMPKITRNNGNVIVLPYPQEYTPDIYDVDASTTGRNAAGTMIRDRVAVKHKFNYKFPPLSQADATEILNAVRDSSFTLTTASPETGAKTNYRVYVGDRSLPVYWMPNHNQTSWLYETLTLNLIEM